MSDLYVWVAAFEQEITEVVSRLEAIRKKLQLSARAEFSDFQTLKTLPGALHREIENLRHLGQRANFKNKQVSKNKETTQPADQLK